MGLWKTLRKKALECTIEELETKKKIFKTLGIIIFIEAFLVILFGLIAISISLTLSLLSLMLGGIWLLLSFDLLNDCTRTNLLIFLKTKLGE